MVDWPSYDPVFRYLHVLSGIVWIGLLYFFNLVNLPLLKIQLSKPYPVNMAEKVTAHITLKTLFYFRWGAFFTLVFGLLLIHVRAVAVGGGDADYAGYFLDRGFSGQMILLGVLMAIVMFVNVWAIIWPNQQKILTNNRKIADGASPEEKARLEAENGPLVKNAVLASRTNTWLSVPMLAGMVFGGHAGMFDSWSEAAGPVATVVAVLLLMVLVSNPKKK